MATRTKAVNKVPRRGRHERKRDDVTLLATAVRYARQGNSRTDCFRLAGVHPDTAFEWLKFARERPGDFPLIVRFARLLERAEAQFRRECVEVVRAHALSGAPNTWQAAMTMLERRDPENWGKRDKTIVEHEGDPITQIQVAVINDPDTRELSRAFLRRVTSPGPDISIGPGVRDESEDA